MNSITREIVERELADIEECHARSIDQVEHFREQLKKSEEARDEYVEQIGALKEGLATLEARTALRMKIDATQHPAADDFIAAVKKYAEQVSRICGLDSSLLSPA